MAKNAVALRNAASCSNATDNCNCIIYSERRNDNDTFCIGFDFVGFFLNFYRYGK